MARSGTGVGYLPSQASTSMPGSFDEEQLALARKRAMLQQLANQPAVESGYKGAHWVNPYRAQLGPALAQTFNALAQPEMDTQAADITARRGAAGEQAVQELMDLPDPGTQPAPAPTPQQMTGGAPDPGRVRSPSEPPGVDYAMPSQVSVETDMPPPAVEEAAINPASVVSTQPQPAPGMVPQALDAAERKQAPGMIPPTAAAAYNKKLAAWALRNAGFSPMHAKIAEKITEGLHLGGSGKGMGKWQVTEIYDDKTGLPQKAWVNTDDPSQAPVPIGGTHAIPPDTHQKDIKYLVDKHGMTERQAAEIVLGANKPLVAPAGSEIVPNNSFQAAGVPPAAAGGMVPQPLNGTAAASPGMVPQPLPAGVPAPLPAKNNAPQAPSNSGVPEGITPNGPYDTRTRSSAPGVTIREGAGTRVGQEKLREDATALNNKIVSSEEARYESALKRAEEVIAKHPKNIPGIGVGMSAVPDPLLSDAGKEVRTALQPLLSTQALMQGGKTLTPSEMENIRKLTATGFMNNQTQTRQALSQLRKMFDEVKARQRKGAHPDVLRLIDSGELDRKASLDDIMGGK